MAHERSTHDLFAGPPDDSMSDDLAAWLGTSSRFRAFAESHRDKIRKKLRSAIDVHARRDVRAELQVAHLLLADRRIELAFEAYGSTKRGPNFTVTFGGERSFNIEVTRMHRAPDLATYGGPLLAKLRQLPPSIPNVVLMAIEGDRVEAFDVAGAARALRARADTRDDAFFTSRGFNSARAFYQRFLRLGAPWSFSAREPQATDGRPCGSTSPRVSRCRSGRCEHASPASEPGDRTHSNEVSMAVPDHVEQFVFVITSRSFAASHAFYAEVIGLELVEEWSDQGHGAVFSAGGPARLEIIDVPDAQDVASSDATFIGLQVTDIDPIHARAVAGSHEIVREPAERPWGGRGFVIRDPNGVAVNVYTAYGPASGDSSATT